MRTRIAGSSRAQVFLVSGDNVEPVSRNAHGLIQTLVKVHVPIPVPLSEMQEVNEMEVHTLFSEPSRGMSIAMLPVQSPI